MDVYADRATNISMRKWWTFAPGTSQLPLHWRHNGRDSVSNHQPHDCLLNRLFRRRSKKTSKLHVTGLCVGNSPGTGEFPAQMASNAENISIWWRHHGVQKPPWWEISRIQGKLIVNMCKCVMTNRGYPAKRALSAMRKSMAGRTLLAGYHRLTSWYIPFHKYSYVVKTPAEKVLRFSFQRGNWSDWENPL